MCWTFTSAPLGKGWGLGVGGGDTELPVNHFIVLFTSRWFYFGQFSQLKVLLKLSKLLSPDGFPVPLPFGTEVQEAGDAGVLRASLVSA